MYKEKKDNKKAAAQNKVPAAFYNSSVLQRRF